MVKGYVHAHEIELRRLSRMTTMGYKSKEMQNVLGRSKSWVTRNSKRLGRNQVAKKSQRVGAPCKITAPVFSKLLKALHALQKKAKGEKEVTVAMIKARAHVTACNRTVPIEHKSYCIYSALLDYSSIDGAIMLGDRFPNLPIAVTKVPSTFQQRIQGLDEAIHIKHKSYCAPLPIDS